MSAESLHRWGITHVITHVVSRNILGLQCEPTIEQGITYLRCSVDDRNSQDMTACFDSSIKFIQEAAKTGGRVLIHIHGRSDHSPCTMTYFILIWSCPWRCRSRSAAVAAAWLMHSQGWAAAVAVQYLLACNAAIDASLMFASQLRRYRPHHRVTLPPVLPALVW